MVNYKFHGELLSANSGPEAYGNISRKYPSDYRRVFL
ncbi:hypothetical protein AB7M26_005232 [Pseudomonas sp. F-14 TE3482]|jgi:hypothetical protein